MIEKIFRSVKCHTVHWYEKANNKYKNDYDKNKESRYAKYSNVSNLDGCATWQKLPVNKFEYFF